jgi:hypothetical protein
MAPGLPGASAPCHRCHGYHFEVDPACMQVRTGFAHFLAGHFDAASSWAESAFRDQPTYLPAAAVTAASNALRGHLDEARSAMKRMREIDPVLHVSNLKDLFPIRRPEHFAKWAEGLRKAGLPG